MSVSAGHFPAKAGADRFLLYLEGPRDREILRNWCRRVSPKLARAVDTSTVLLGGRQPVRAVHHHRRRLAAGHPARGICILDRDGLPDKEPAAGDPPGLEFFTWPRRHIESYLLVPAAILRCLPRNREGQALKRLIADFLPDAGDEAAFRVMDAKSLLSERGPLCEVAGLELRPGHIARSMAEAELHSDVTNLLSRIEEGFGIRRPEIYVVARPA